MVVGLSAAGIGGDAGGDARLGILDVYVTGVVGVVARRQQVGVGLEGYPAAVGGDGRVVAGEHPLMAVGISGDPDRCPGLGVLEKDILPVVVIERHQVGGVGFEGYVAAVGGDGGRQALGARLVAAGIGGDPRDVSRLDILQVDVADVVGIPSLQEVGVRLEGDPAAVGGDGRVVAMVSSHIP